MQNWGVPRSNCCWVVNHDQTGFQLPSNRWWVVCSANHVTSLDLLLIYTPQIKADIVTCFGRFKLGMVSLYRLNFASGTRRHHYDFLTGLHFACLNPAYWDGSDTGNRVDILYRNSQGLSHWLFWWV